MSYTSKAGTHCSNNKMWLYILITLTTVGFVKPFLYTDQGVSSDSGSSYAYASSWSSAGSTGEQAPIESTVTIVDDESASASSGSGYAYASSWSSSGGPGAPGPIVSISRRCPQQCKQTCENPSPNARYCGVNRNCSCPDKDIVEVYVNSRNNTCIDVYSCPKNVGCNGDINAMAQIFPHPCQATCSQPSPNRQPCNKAALRLGCVCKPGYILSGPGGRCIRPERCPGGYPCGRNELFNSCSIECYGCPTRDDIATVCSYPSNCPSGCTCKHGYLRGPAGCVLPQNCPPAICTSPNTEWLRCPPPCFTDSCSRILEPAPPCDIVVNECQPRCACKEGYSRGNDGACIPNDQCV